MKIYFQLTMVFFFKQYRLIRYFFWVICPFKVRVFCLQCMKLFRNNWIKMKLLINCFTYFTFISIFSIEYSGGKWNLSKQNYGFVKNRQPWMPNHQSRVLSLNRVNLGHLNRFIYTSNKDNICLHLQLKTFMDRKNKSTISCQYRSWLGASI